MSSLKFPKSFFWGAATSAHQVEGGNQNDWTEWEKKNSKIKSQKAKLRTWPDYILNNYPNPLQEENYISGRATDHYNRFPDDFDIAQKLGHNAHRFSIEWSRIEPEEGKFNQKEIEHYREVIRALRERGLEPFVTLWHWTLPLWLRDIRGWTNRKSVDFFLRYAERMAREFPEVRFWVTFNETNTYTGHGYWRGDWPPGYKSVRKYISANYHLSQAHRQTYAAIKKINARAQVGVAHMYIYFSQSGIKSFGWNHIFLRSLRECQDFVGVNYYFSDRRAERVSEFLDWPIDPNGLYEVLKEAARYDKPIYVLENGIADVRDVVRTEFIKDHIEAMERAIREDIPLRGYFYWSLLDNFEWDNGFWPRFGLVEIDYRTMERKIRPSAWEYKKIIESEEID